MMMDTLVAPPPKSDRMEQFASDVRAGLSKRQKELPSKYLYDALGSTLFEAICLLPEYGLTRADQRLLTRYAQEIVDYLPHPVLVSELGSGSAKKTRAILEALCARGRVSYYPIEISPGALASCAAELADLQCVSVVGVEREYLDGLRSVVSMSTKEIHRLVLFLGSTIGNFDCGADVRFLSQVRKILAPGDALLLGTDLVKPIEVLMSAYDDPLGVTASFNLNLLARVNRELEGDFDLAQFAHVARFDAATSSIEMHLLSRKRQVVNVRRSGIAVLFEKGETIWTESCHKYTLRDIAALAAASGFRIAGQWIDEIWPFAESLFIAE